MSKRIKIPLQAKREARRGLQEREKNKAGLTPSEAKILNITSGVDRANQLIKRDTLSESDAKQVARFYLRFRNRTGAKAETALRLWGGRKFGLSLARKYYS
jgi:hypothetical protein